MQYLIITVVLMISLGNRTIWCWRNKWRLLFRKIQSWSELYPLSINVKKSMKIEARNCSIWSNSWLSTRNNWEHLRLSFIQSYIWIKVWCSLCVLQESCYFTFPPWGKRTCFSLFYTSSHLHDSLATLFIVWCIDTQVNNYALTMHLKQAQQSSSIPGRFHPDVF